MQEFIQKEIESLIKRNIINNKNFEFNSKINIWFGTNGLISFMFKPQNENELQIFLKNIDSKIKIFPIGMGSNLLISDQGFNNGICIKFIKFNNIEYNEESSEIVCGSGVLDKTLSKFALDNSIKGLEFLYTIPGNIGGAVFMNAGCFENEIKDIFIKAICFDRNGNKIILNKNDINFEYRSSNLENIFISEVVFHAEKENNKQKIFEKMNMMNEKRNINQPSNVKTAGSTFKNPVNHSKKAWEMLDSVSMRGFRIGGAHFSEKHCNFIINDKSATSCDIKKLIEEAQKRVFEKFNIILEKEIIFLGFDNEK
jgi:UDP-N-acetylmuramate dehydrogenase